MEYCKMTKKQLEGVYSETKEKLDEWKKKDLKLDITRGKPSQEQLELTTGMLSILSKPEDCFSENGMDIRNYGVLDGLPEAKKLFSDLLGIPSANIFVAGNSSLNLMYDTMVRCMLFGVAGGREPWYKQGNIKFLCPAPGYDRHFKICNELDIQMIPIDMKPDGPDIDKIYELACSDPSIKGIWCVPKFSNPDGITYSDEVVEKLAALKPAARDFRIFWDNAYAVHELYDETVELADIFKLAKKYGNEDNIFYFASTSKITFPGSGLAIMAASKNNLDYFWPTISTQTIGFDKINQMRHYKYFKNVENLHEHMRKHAAIIRPKFELVENKFASELGGLGIADWTDPRGGYFISLYLNDGCAKKVYELAKQVGVKLTPAGATYPYGRDPRDRNLRIAPTYPPIEELDKAIEILCLCVKNVAASQLLDK